MKKAVLLGSTWAAGAAITTFGFGLAPPRKMEPAPSVAISLESSIGYAESLANEAANNIANAEHVRGLIQTALAEAKQMQQDAQMLLAEAGRTHDATQESVERQKAQIICANILHAKGVIKEQEALAIERYRNEVRYGANPASYEEARFSVVKARTLAVLANLDASLLPPEDQAAFEAYREVMTPQIAAATMDSPLGAKINDIEIPTRLSSIVCPLLNVNIIGKTICGLVVDQLEDALGGEVIDKTVEKYKEKFKNLSPLDAMDCLKQALDQSMDANFRDFINLNPHHISPHSLTGFESFFKDPHRELDFSGPFNRALDRCIETRNQQIEQERQERERQERERRERHINDRYRESGGSSRSSDDAGQDRSRDNNRDSGGGRDSGGSGGGGSGNSGGGCERNSGPKENFCDGLRDLGIDRDCGGNDSSGGDGGNDGGGDCGGDGDDGMGIALRLSQMRQNQYC